MDRIEKLDDIDLLSHQEKVRIIEHEIIRVVTKSGFKIRDRVIKGYNYALLRLVDKLLCESCYVEYQMFDGKQYETIDLSYALEEQNFDNVTIVSHNAFVAHIEYIELAYLISFRIKKHRANYIRLVDIKNTGNHNMLQAYALRSKWYSNRNVNIAKELVIASPNELLDVFYKLGVNYTDTYAEGDLQELFDNSVYLSTEDLTTAFLREFYRFKLAGWVAVC